MTRSAQQTYIQRLGFQDKDRSNPRHGLACEYLLARLAEIYFAPIVREGIWNARSHYSDLVECKHKLRYDENLLLNADFKKRYDLAIAEDMRRTQERQAFLENFDLYQDMLAKIQKEIFLPSQSISVPIKSKDWVCGFADVLLCGRIDHSYFHRINSFSFKYHRGDPKYSDSDELSASVLGEVKITPEPAENVLQQIAFYRTFLPGVQKVYIVVDYDASQLKRMTKDSDITVLKLGQNFENWCNSQSANEDIAEA